MKISALIVTWLVAFGMPAAAVPPNKIIRLQAGQARFEPGYNGDWIATSLEPDKLSARAFDTAEVHLASKGAGLSEVLLTNRILRQVIIWRVEMDAEPLKPDPAPVKKACGCDPSQRPLTCRLSSGACIDALRAYLATADVTADQLRLAYTVEGLQAQVRHLGARLQAAGFDGIEVAFVGTNLRLRGRVADWETWSKLQLLIYREFVGRLLLDDQLVIGTGSDGGP